MNFFSEAVRRWLQWIEFYMIEQKRTLQVALDRWKEFLPLLKVLHKTFSLVICLFLFIHCSTTCPVFFHCSICQYRQFSGFLTASSAAERPSCKSTIWKARFRCIWANWFVKMLDIPNCNMANNLLALPDKSHHLMQWVLVRHPFLWTYLLNINRKVVENYSYTCRRFSRSRYYHDAGCLTSSYWPRYILLYQLSYCSTSTGKECI